VYNHRRRLAGDRGAEKNITAQLRDERYYVYIVVVDVWWWWWWRWWRDGEGMRNDGRRSTTGRDDRCSRKGGGGVVKFKTPISVHYARARRNHIYVLTPAVGEAAAAASSVAGRRVRSAESGGQASARRHGVTAETQRRTRVRPAMR